VQICPNCGEENPDRFRICGLCGTKLAPDVVAEEVRKTVSIVFCDLKGSTALGEKLDPESLREVLNVYFNEMKTVLEHHGGRVEKYIGDAVMAVFGLPRAHEDDALRAVRAAADMQRALSRVNDQLEARWDVRLNNRTGVFTGEVVAGDVTTGQRLVTGDAVNTAARLEQNAPTNEVLIGDPTYRLVKAAVEVEEVEPLELKGKAERTPAYRLVSITRDEGVVRRLDVPMVGREKELRVLQEALERAIEERSAQIVTVFAPAGVGKSRLLQELISTSAGRAAAYRGRCLSYGDGITFWPLAEMVREASGVSDEGPREARAKIVALLGDERSDVEERLAAAIGLSEATFPVQETFWAARTFLETLARERPVIAIIEDIHWAEQSFLDLLAFVRDSVHDAPILLICSSRPELLEEGREWTQEHDNARTVTLEPLSDEESSLVVENLLGQAALDEAAKARIIHAAEGNPLFVEQMLSMLVDDGVIRRDEEGRWVLVGDVGALTIPPSINALLTARLDRLGPAERAVVERGAVIGHQFFGGAVSELVPEGVRDQVDQCLDGLIRKELIRPTESVIAGEEAYQFLHILIREAAYHGVLKRTRAVIHEGFVDWAERVDPDRAVEFAEIRGYHLEEAFLILAQLGPLDMQGKQVGLRGAQYLSSAGKRALARGDMHAAANLLQRAGNLLPERHPGRPRLQLDAGEALIEVGEFILAEASLAGAQEGAGKLELPGLGTTAGLVRQQMHFMTEGKGTEEELIRDAQAAIPMLERLDDHEGLARAYRLLWIVHATASRNRDAERAALKTMEHARLAGDHVMETRFSTSLAFAALYGPTQVREAIERCRQVLIDATGDRKAEALTLVVLARLEGMEGAFVDARDKYGRSRASLDELGWKLHAALTSLVSGPLEMSAGDLARAEDELVQDYEALQKMGERNYIATTAAFLAEAKYRQGLFGEAEGLSAVSQEIAAPDDAATQAMWRGVGAKVLARAGRMEEAESLVREAVTVIDRTDDLNLQGDTRLDLSEVLALAGRRDDAALAREEAAALFERKGNTVSAARAKTQLSLP
jgi:class 3 adenylate cyclase/tetratricopeptide (TPR) repeat protein